MTDHHPDDDYPTRLQTLKDQRTLQAANARHQAKIEAKDREDRAAHIHKLAWIILLSGATIALIAWIVTLILLLT